MVTEALDPDEWQQVRGTLSRILDAHGASSGVSPYALGFRTGDQAEEFELNSRHPLARGATVVFPPIAMEVDGSHVAAEIDFGPSFEGPPGLVHGGFISAAFDIIVSSAASQVVRLNVTRWLRIRFLRPTFLGQVVRFEADAVPDERRLITVTARCMDADGRTTARAEAQCVQVDFDRFADRRRSPGPVA